MTQLEKLEVTLDDTLNKKAPVKIPEDGRKALAGALWWLALVLGLLQLWAAWNLWHLGHRVNELVNYVNDLSAAYGRQTVDGLGFMYYVSLLVIVVAAAILLLAAPALKAMRKSGWNLLFYSLLLNVVYGLVVMFTDYGGPGQFVWAVVASLVGAYFLFQVRGHFMKSGAHPVADKPKAAK